MTDPFDLRPEDRADSTTGALPALAVLMPLLAAGSAAALLALGHLLRLADTPGTLPGSLIGAGWILAVVAAVSILIEALLGLAQAVQKHRQ